MANIPRNLTRSTNASLAKREWGGNHRWPAAAGDYRWPLTPVGDADGRQPTARGVS